jgi:hypothetical protein
MISAVVDFRQRSPILLSILQVRWLHRSWDSEIDVHCGGIRHLCCENGYGESRSVGFVADSVIGDEAIEIVLSGPSVNDGQKPAGKE